MCQTENASASARRATHVTHLRLVSFPHSKGYAVKMREQESQAHQVYAHLVEHMWEPLTLRWGDAAVL
jgi:hypothetical protein